MDEFSIMSTSDVYLAALFLAKGVVLDKVDRADPKHMEFTFKSDSVNLEEVERAWVNRTAEVNAFDFSEALKRLKSVIHSG